MEINLNEVKTFYNPHSGSGGPSIPLPVDILNVVRALDGQSLPLRKALRRIRAVTAGRLQLIEGDDDSLKYIVLSLFEANGDRYVWRIICYR